MQKQITQKFTNGFFSYMSMFKHFLLNNYSKLKKILYKTKKG